jgi:hypothetical protein
LLGIKRYITRKKENETVKIVLEWEPEERRLRPKNPRRDGLTW